MTQYRLPVYTAVTEPKSLLESPKVPNIRKILRNSGPQKVSFWVLSLMTGVCVMASLYYLGVVMAGVMTATQLKGEPSKAYDAFLFLSMTYPIYLFIGIVGGWITYKVKRYKGAMLWMLLPILTFLAFPTLLALI